VLAVLVTYPAAQAHEISPSVSDLTINGNNVTFDLQLNIESFVARIDLQALENTDNTEVANDYDQYRAMPADQLELEFRSYWPEMATRLRINAPQPLTLVLQQVAIPVVGDVKLPRESSISLSATLSNAAAPGVTVSCPA